MGNILCKNRVNHSNNPKSPVDRVLGRCAQICPKSLGKQKHFWDKQVLETSPPLQNQPITDSSGWNSASLTVPDSPQGNDVDHPVAPPRKKRPSMLRKDDPPLRNGFKDIFAGNRSESTTTSDSQGDVKDFTDFEKVPLNRGTVKEMEKEKEKSIERSMEKSTERNMEKNIEKNTENSVEENMEKVTEKNVENSAEKIKEKSKEEMEKHMDERIEIDIIKSMHEEPREKVEIQLTDASRSSEERSELNDSKTNILSTKCLKIGNKKSDKFFGENLSDCLSDEPMVQELEEEILKINQAMLQPHSNENKFEEAEGAIKQQLLASLSTLKDIKMDESIDEPDRVAVEEPIITKVIVTRHVCDDEDELRAHLHSDHDHTYVVPDPNAPKKPQRDFAKYKKQNDVSTPIKISDTTAVNSEQGDDTTMDLLSQIQKELPPSNSILAPKAKGSISMDLGDTPVTQDAAQLVAVISESLAMKENENKTKTDEENVPKKAVTEPLIEKMLQSEEALKSELSSQSFLTQDIMEHIAQQVRMADGYQPEDYSSSNDGSEIAPSSKLAQKRSLNAQAPYTDSSNNSTSKTVTETSKKPVLPLIIQKIEVKGSNAEEPTSTPNAMPEAKEPETPPVFYKLTTASPLLANQTEVNRESPEEKSVVKKRKPRELQPKVYTSPESANENISKAIKSFMEKDDLQPEDILTLLEEEFGELLQGASLPGEDRKLIDELRNVVNRKASISEEPEPEYEPAVVEKVTVDTATPQLQEGPKIVLQVASEEKSQIMPEDQPPLNASIVSVVPSNVSRVLSDDKRRHSIDEFDHWFAGGLSSKAEVPMRKRKREASLPGYLITNTSMDEVGGLIERLNFNKDRSKDDTDDVLNKQNTSVVTTTAIHIFEPIPESNHVVSPVQEKTEITIISLDPKVIQKEPPASTRVEQAETKNHSNRPILRDEKNRIMLLKFLDIERSNSFK